MMEFHVSRKARDRYQFNGGLFSYNGDVVFANLAASREFAHRMNRARDAEKHPEKTIHPGALFAMGLIDELSHALVAAYRKQADREAIQAARVWFEHHLGPQAVDKLLLAFVKQFPGLEVYRGEKDTRLWLAGETRGIAHRTVAFEEMMMLWLANANPAFHTFQELFDDLDLAGTTCYREVAGRLREFFETRRHFGPENLNLIDMLRAPALASPESLTGQLAYIREKWAAVLGPLDRILLALDVLKEEDIAIWMRFHPPTAGKHGWGGMGVMSEVPSYAGAAYEYERFSPDQDWMPTTVLLAKSTYVWLEQLSRKYGRHIHRLDHVPDEELEMMRRRGLNALWLIGVWERSRASRTIKRLCGSQDAVASAYSLNGYDIAGDLGGEEAYRNLRDRAAFHGVRLASDMVPNHMGIDSDWVINHPEWFLSRSDSPYPSYSFEGPNLSSDGRVEIKIDDHYYTQSDAAVVFRRRDTWTGDNRYIYHGNDGTSFPWNDTAQIDYLNPAAREQVIQTILHVARLFPIIRFDAAMTLAKRHVQRLWYPLPGSGGSIPSRAEFSMSKEQFDRAMPEEFWREVVDRVAREVPGTLLLAEAFWLMEGYFVRTLGMHRVYNSAFMNMLRDEENAKYRSVIKNTMEFDPDILKRYVNFMSNPDERTAIDQFGTEGKYFGVATLMATLPGLPMFGHGQIEGFTEKYGMEYRVPRYREEPNRQLTARHEREIAPLLHRRWLFAESRNFLLFDFYRPDGSVDENVFAYSNRAGNERALVVYHNRYATTSGTIHHSAAYADKSVGGLRRDSLGMAWGLPNDGGVLMAYRDAATGAEHLMRSSRIHSEGIGFDLQAYQRHVFLDWRELRPDENHRWDGLCDWLNGRGVPSLMDGLISFELAHVHSSLASLFDPGLLHAMARSGASPAAPAAARNAGSSDPARSSGNAAGDPALRIEQESQSFFEQARLAYGRQLLGTPCGSESPQTMWLALRRRYLAILDLPALEDQLRSAWSSEARQVLPSQSPARPASAVWGQALAFCLLASLSEATHFQEKDRTQRKFDSFDRLRLREPLARVFDRLGLEGEDSWRAAARVRLAAAVAAEPDARNHVAGLPAWVWDDPDARWLLEIHDSSGPASEAHTYFNKELHEQLLWWLSLPELIEIAGASSARATKKESGKPAAQAKPSMTAQEPTLSKLEHKIQKALADANRAGYRLDELRARKPARASRSRANSTGRKPRAPHKAK